MSHSPNNRAQDILRRIEEHSSQFETVKTCFGILAIMSRDESHKVLIAVDGMERILNAMMINIDKPDVQEAGCDLLWSLAFSSSKVKEVIGKYGGTTVLVRGLKRHSKSADFLKSACGALSNLCQSKMNQHGFSSHGGIQPLVGAISFHQQNYKLLPFIFDALASLIVGNEENAKMMSVQDGITLILSTLAKLRTHTDVVKSGCHALAILSDVKGQANKIALAGGVVIILSLLDLHPSYADFHRVAAVVLLRMLQETPAIAREITANDGVRILLKSLDKGGALEDTVAAVTHILSSITSPLNANSSMIESQLWLSTSEGNEQQHNGTARPSSKRGAVPNKGDPSLEWQLTSKSIQSLNSSHAQSGGQVSALKGLVSALDTYAARRDVVRAGCRLLSHVIGFAGVVMALDSLSIMDRIFHCVSIHSETKDVLESTASLLKAIHRRTSPMFTCSKPSILKGVMVILRYKIIDDDIVTACMELFCKYHGIKYGTGEKHSASNIPRSSGDKNYAGVVMAQHLETWELDCLGMCNKVVETLLGSDHNAIDLTTGLIKCLSQQRKTMSSSSTKSTKMLNAVITLVEKIVSTNKGVLNAGPWENHPQVNTALSRSLHTVSDTLTPKYSDIIRKIEAVLPSLTNRCERPISGHRNFAVSSSIPVVNSISVRPSPRTNSGENISGHPPLRPSSSNTAIPLGTGAITGYAIDKSSPRTGAPDNGRRNTASSLSSASSTPRATIMPASSADASAAGDLADGNRKLDLESSTSLHPLLINWPVYLEKIITQPMSAVNRSLDNLFESTVPRMHVVYDCKSAAGLNIPSRCPINLPYSVPPGGVGSSFDHSASFNSEFECGNIQTVIQRGERVYDMCLRPDVHTPGHTQWFYFSVSNVHNSTVTSRANLGLPVNKIVKLQFNIINFTKPDSSFNSGMKPVFYSMQDATKKGIGWVRRGSEISYTANEYQRFNAAGEGMECYFTLSFCLEFKNVDDTCLIAYSYPYSYSDCRLHIDSLIRVPRSSDIIRRYRLCKTLSGKDCDLLIVTDFTDRDNIGPLGSSSTPVANVLPAFDSLQEQLKPGPGSGKIPKRNKTAFRRGIVISARVHPGETPASWVMRGALDYLVSDFPGAVLLRRNFVFFIVPMLNPDGVIFGNNRCSLAGVDLNRQWKIPMKHQHPTVYHLKTLMQEQKSFREIVMYVDIHGHSRKYNVFLYGCDDKKKPNAKAREFPRIFSQHDTGKKYVSLTDCSFHVKKSREGTARVVASRDLMIPMSYTIEATFCGPDSGPLKFYHMNIGHLLDCGGAMCDSILQYTFADAQFPEGTILPESFKGLMRIDQNSYISPDDAARRGGPMSISVESARGVFNGGLQTTISETEETSISKHNGTGRNCSSNDEYRKEDSSQSVIPDSADEDDVIDKDSISRNDNNCIDMTVPLADDSGFLSGSSDEDEEPDGMDGDNDDDSVAANDVGCNQKISSEADEYDSTGDGEDCESVNSFTNAVGIGKIRSNSAPSAEDDTAKRDLTTSPIAKSVKTRTNLRALIDDKDHSIAGPIASQRITDGIAMLPRNESNSTGLENM